MERSETYHRVWLMTTTAAAQQGLTALKEDLAAPLRARESNAGAGSCAEAESICNSETD